jgi:ubiquinone/menaquinone biosynthesis C-methylase UbiE
MNGMTDNVKGTIKEKVKQRYGAIAEGATRPAPSSCCGPSSTLGGAKSNKMGYSIDELGAIPDSADLGLGCGNPLGLEIVKEGDTVLDLGSGGGIDCFIASKKVGPKGKVIGVDMTPQMLELARQNAAKGGYANVEFREGHIEALPVDDNSVDVIISNCVINLSEDKGKVFREMLRALKPGGKFVVSDVTLLKPLPGFIRDSLEAYIGCVAGALLKDDFISAAKSAGFSAVTVEKEASYRQMAESYFAGGEGSCCGSGGQISEKILEVASSVTSVTLSGVKPA